MKCHNCEKNLEEWEKEEGYETIYRCSECQQLSVKL